MHIDNGNGIGIGIGARQTIHEDGVIPPPPGVTPSLNNPENSYQRFRTANSIISGIGIGLCTFCLVMRVYTKARLLRKFWWDDMFIISAWVFSLATQATILWGYGHAGYGLHMWDMPDSLYSSYIKSVLATSITYILALALAKLSLLILFHTLLSLTPFWRYLIYTIAFLITGYSIALTLALIFGCSPLQKSWNPRITEGSCISQNGVYLATAITNSVSDLVLIVIPVPIVVKLRLGFWRRIGVVCMFGVGGLTTIMSIIRLVTLVPQISAKDQSWSLAEANIYIFIEANLIILCACLPYLRQYWRHHAPGCLTHRCSILGHRICRSRSRARSRQSSQEKGRTAVAPLRNGNGDRDRNGHGNGNGNGFGIDDDVERALAVNGPIPSSHVSVDTGGRNGDGDDIGGIGDVIERGGGT
ncbi:hypothetical protein BJX70DRAFT_404501 [Aspergillus crustosus]